MKDSCLGFRSRTGYVSETLAYGFKPGLKSMETPNPDLGTKSSNNRFTGARPKNVLLDTSCSFLRPHSHSMDRSHDHPLSTIC